MRPLGVLLGGKPRSQLTCRGKASLGFARLHFSDECLEATDLICLLFGSESAQVITQPCLAAFQAGKMVFVHSELLFL